MSGSEDFTGKYIELTYKKVVHVSDDNYLMDGTGSFVHPIISGSLTMSGSINMNGNKIQTVGTPSESQDAVNKLFLENTITNQLNYTSSINTSSITEISFDRTLGYIYGTMTTPLSGSITMNTGSNNLIGVVNLIIHNDVTGITLPGTFKRLSGIYDSGSINNYIYVQYIDSSSQLYTISKVN